MIVYCATNKINGKKYVGKTTQDLCERLKAHICDAIHGRGYIFHRAIFKYGIENFQVDVLCQCSSKQELIDAEKYWIKNLNSMSPVGYNLTSGGEWGELVGEARERATKNMKGKKHSNLGVPRPQWVKDKISKSKKGTVYKTKGIPKSEETRRKISKSKLGKKRKPFSIETRIKMSVSHKGKVPWNKGIKRRNKCLE